MLKPDDLALFALLLAINTWIFIICDSFALQIIIQYGFNESALRKANTFALVLHIGIALVTSIVIYLLGEPVSVLFNESRMLEITAYLPILSLMMIPRTFFGKFLLKEHNLFQIFWMDFIFFGTISIMILYYKFNLNIISLQESIDIYLIGAGSSSIYGFIVTFRKVKLGLSGSLPFKKVLTFTVPFTITNAMASLPKQLDILILKLFFDLHTIGVYQAAKSLFRLFEEGINGANGLIYPALVKHFEKQRLSEVISIVTKGISFILLTYILISIMLVAGLSTVLVGLFMKTGYLYSIQYFNILLIATIFLPFTILNFVITASGKHKLLLKNVSIAFAFSIIIYIISGITGIKYLLPTGYISFFGVLAMANYSTVKNNILMDLKFPMFLRSIGDTFGYFSKKNNSQED